MAALQLKSLQLAAGENNILYKPLVPRDKIIFLLLHIKLGLIEQFVKALDKEGSCFEYICKALPGGAIEKLKTGIFDSPDIKKLIKSQNVVTSINKLESKRFVHFLTAT